MLNLQNTYKRTHQICNDYKTCYVRIPANFRFTVFHQDILISMYLQWKEQIGCDRRESHKSLETQKAYYSVLLLTFLSPQLKFFMEYLLLQVFIPKSVLIMLASLSENAAATRAQKWMRTFLPSSAKCQVLTQGSEHPLHIQQPTHHYQLQDNQSSSQNNKNQMRMDYDS